MVKWSSSFFTALIVLNISKNIAVKLRVSLVKRTERLLIKRKSTSQAVGKKCSFQFVHLHRSIFHHQVDGFVRIKILVGFADWIIRGV